MRQKLVIEVAKLKHDVANLWNEITALREDVVGRRGYNEGSAQGLVVLLTKRLVVLKTEGMTEVLTMPIVEGQSVVAIRLCIRCIFWICDVGDGGREGPNDEEVVIAKTQWVSLMVMGHRCDRGYKV